MYFFIFIGYADLVFSFVWQFVFGSLGIVIVSVGRSPKQPGGSLSSVDRSPGSPRRYLSVEFLYTVPDHGGLGPLASLVLLVLMLYHFVCNTGTLSSVTVQTVG